jgi:predicted ArsR family transcriptional regulator
MARALERDAANPTNEQLRKVAYDSGRTAATDGAAGKSGAPETADKDVRDTLSERGYEAYVSPDGDIRLRNCPFDRLAEQHRGLVCGANLAFVEGVVDGLGVGNHLQPRLDPHPGECCVALHSRENANGD